MDLRVEMSAYLDGECVDPAELAARLEGDPALALELAQLQAMLGEVRQLPGPALRPEFVTRVLAQVREELPDARAPWWSAWFSLPRLATVGGLCAASLVLGIAWRGAMAPAPRIDPVEDVATAPRDDAGSVLDRLTAAGADVAALAEEFGGVEADDDAMESPLALEDAEIDEIFLAMQDAAWTNDDADELDVIEQLGAEDQGALQRLLQPSAYSDSRNEG